MLAEHETEYRYREYTQDPLSANELRKLVRLLGKQPHELLRRNDAAYKQLGLQGNEPATKLIALMAEHPTLLQRPIAVDGKRAVVGRPVENILELL